MKRPLAELLGTGSYAPARVVTNSEISTILDTSDQWIWDRTGIRERRVARPDESNACMAKAAAERALQASGLTPLDLDTIIVATCTPDRLLPSQACDLQALLGATNAAAFDVSAACTGFIYALNVAEGLVASEQAATVLVVASEKLTSIVDWTDRTTAVLFGDGAGATVIRRSANGRGILSTYMKSDGTLADLLYRPAGGAVHPPDAQMLTDRSHFVRMVGTRGVQGRCADHGRRVRHGAGASRPRRRRPRSPDSAPGQPPHHRSDGEARGPSDGEGLRQPGPVRQHLRRLGRDRARRSCTHRAADARDEGDVRGVRRGLHMGEHGPPVVAPGKTVWLCPGQGAQKVGMGKDLAERFPAARLVFEAVDEALSFRLSQVMFEGPEDALTDTHNAQPAILAHTAAIFAVLGNAVGTAATAAGHSLGEYSAYLTAGALAAPDAAVLVRQRGDLMQRSGGAARRHGRGTRAPGSRASRRRATKPPPETRSPSPRT